jgi:hypothetical protein
VGGNTGTTLGEQRRIALEHAMSLWGAQLDSPVAVVVEVQFEDMGCTDEGAVLAGAAPADSFEGLVGHGADPSLFYPSALADSLMGRDLELGRPDILMYINSGIDSHCNGLAGFYYGLDAKAEAATDFVEVMLHELAHGLGIHTSIDRTTGELFVETGVDPFTALIRDLDLDRTWDRLSAAERRRSATNVTRLVFDGPLAAQRLPDLAAMGPPLLSFSPAVSGYSGMVGDAAVGVSPLETPAVGRVVVAQGCALTAPEPAGSSWIGLFSSCPVSQALRTAADAGVSAALLVLRESSFDAPAPPLEPPGTWPDLTFPIATLTASDAEAIREAAMTGRLEASLSGDPTRRLGADDRQRPLLFATRPVSNGSSVAHLDWSMRPNQLMEAFASSTPTRDLSLTQAMLRDLGWLDRCGDGHLDGGEECDQGGQNSDDAPDACRSDCRAAHCGDGVHDRAEGCDTGADNRDNLANACRSDCTPARCGDGVIDDEEQCDRGAQNSDVVAGGCRTTCRLAGCGDGVVDGLEQCDRGESNSDTTRDSCRRDCRLARCGDGVVDQGEDCDEGNGHDANECRRDCTLTRCGDGIVDRDEACDGTRDCLPSCEISPPTEPPIDTMQDRPDSGTIEIDAGPVQADAPGCGCEVAGRDIRGTRFQWLVLLGLGVGVHRRRRGRAPT